MLQQILPVTGAIFHLTQVLHDLGRDSDDAEFEHNFLAGILYNTLDLFSSSLNHIFDS